MEESAMDFKLRINAKYFGNDGILDDLHKVAKRLGKKNISGREYLREGTFSLKVYRNRFGSWNKALQKAGLSIVRDYEITEKLLLENLEKVWRKLGSHFMGK